MRIRPTLIALSLGLALASCGGPKTLTYRLQLATQDPAQRIELIDGTQRMVTRRMAAISAKGTVIASPVGDAGKLVIKLEDGGKASSVQNFLSQPFSFELKGAMKKTPPPPPDQEEWTATGITGTDLQWLRAIGDKATGKIGVELIFTPEGKAKLKRVFDQFTGGELGIFVRDLLVSKLTVAGGSELDKSIIITGIPSPAVAQIFVDDVNVGLHVSFTKQ